MISDIKPGQLRCLKNGIFLADDPRFIHKNEGERPEGVVPILRLIDKDCPCLIIGFVPFDDDDRFGYKHHYPVMILTNNIVGWVSDKIDLFKNVGE